jgi:CheY-like chemotaxis protein
VLIEDSEDTRETLRKLLELHGHRVHTASDGANGLTMLLAVRPDIALIDIGLPGIDGYEVARRARAAGVRAHFVAFTGYGLAQDNAQSAAAGFDAHLTKPASADRILELVSDFCAANSARA